jgi:hypothetical protein
MFNKKLKDRLIVLEEEVATLRAENNLLYHKTFRVGDPIYVNDGKRPLDTIFYLRESFNNSTAYYITAMMKGRYETHLSYAVSVRDISHEKPDKCKCCGKLAGSVNYE